MNQLKTNILKTRTIKDISLKNYLSSINQLSKKITKKEFSNLDFLKDYDNVINILDNFKDTTKKNYLTALIVALKSEPNKYKDEINKYCVVLKKLSNDYQEKIKENKKSDTQENNWITYDELIKKKDDLKNKYKSNKTFNNLQKYLILLTYINHPLRNDYAEMKIMKKTDYNKLDDKEKDKYNYLILSGNKYYFYINQYKTKKSLGNRIIEIKDKELKRVINLWLKMNNSGWYFVKADEKTPHNPNSTTKYLNKLFYPKKISSSMIRHIIISHERKNDLTIKEEEEKKDEIENKFLHSKEMNKKYRKV